jgi:putative ABC transport system permease protein
MTYSLATLWHERQRYLPGVLAVAFSALLIAMQWGLLLGIFAQVGTPIDRARADIWVGYPGVPSVDIGPMVPQAWEARLANQPEITRVEPYVRGMVLWGKRDGGAEICTVLGTQLDDGALGPVPELTPELRARLAEPGAVVVDQSELANLGLRNINDTAEVNGTRVRLVGTVHGVRGMAGAYLFCSIPTGRALLGMAPDQASYLLASCRRPEDAPAVVDRLAAAYPNMTPLTRDDFASRSRLYWLTKTKTGLALGCSALLGLLVGAAVTSQTLYAATAASLRQFAVLEALGIPTWRMSGLVVSQSFWVGLLGIGVAIPLVLLLGSLAEAFGARILLSAWLLGCAVTLTLVMALLSGLIALRCLRLVEPTALLR